MALQPLRLSLGRSCRAYVSYVLSPAEFWIQLADGEGDLDALMTDLNSGVARAADGPVSPKAPYAAVYSEDGRVYRALVTGKLERDAYAVQFVDYGNSEVKRADELMRLDERFTRLPCQAAPCHLQDVSSSGTAELQQLVLSEVVTVTVHAQSANGSYGVDIATTGVESVLTHLRAKYPQRATAVVGGGGGREPAISAPLQQKQQGLPDYAAPLVPAAGRPVSAVVCYSVGPDRFWVYLKEREQDLVRLATAITEYINGGDRSLVRWSSAPVLGMPCLAQSNLDWQWYRARVMAAGSSGQHQVYFVDYGSSEPVPLSQICQLPPKLLEMLPRAQALECCLANVVPHEHRAEDVKVRFGELIACESVQITTAGPAPSSGPVPVNILVPEVGSVAELLAQEGLVIVKSARQEQPLPGSGAAGEPAATSTGKGARARLGYKSLQLPAPDTTVAAAAVYVTSPGSFWCHLRVNEDSLLSVQDELNRLCNGDGGVPLPPRVTDPRPGMPCCSRFSSDGLWYRARIREVLDTDCVVDYVDYGNTERVRTDTLLQLPPSLLAIPPQAVPCALLVGGGGRSRGSADRKDAWTSGERDQFESLVLHQPLQLHVSHHAADGVLIVDVLTKAGPVSTLLQQSGSNQAGDAAARRRIEEDGSAAARAAPDRAPTSPRGGRLLMAAKSVPADLGAASAQQQPLTVLVDGGGSGEAAALSAAPVAGTRERVRIVWIVSPNEFYCHRDSSEKVLLHIEEGVAKAVEAHTLLRKPAPGATCLARYSVDGQWYRTLIKAVLPTGWSMYFMDYGNAAAVPNSAPLLEMNSSLAAIPAQAVNCKLRGIVPISVKGEWADDVRDKMELVVSSGKDLYATFLACHLGSNLVDLYLADGTSVAEVLVTSGVAKAVRGDVPLGSRNHSPIGTSAMAATGPKVSASSYVATEQRSSPRAAQHGGHGSGGNFASQPARRDAAVVAPPARHDSGAASPRSWPAPASGFHSPARPDVSSSAARPGHGFSPSSRSNQGFPPAARPDQGFHAASRPDSGHRPSTRPDFGGFRTKSEPVGFHQPPVSRESGFQPPMRSDSGSASWGVTHDNSVAATGDMQTSGQRNVDSDSSSRPGRFHRKPVERMGQQPRRPREHMDNGGEQTRSFAGLSSLSRQPDGSAADSEAWPENKPAREVVKSITAPATVAGHVTEGFKGIDLDGGMPYAAYVSYMPSEQSLDSTDASLQLCIQLQRDEGLLQAVQDGIAQCTAASETNGEPSRVGFRPRVGAPCLAQYSADGAWYRAEVTALDSAADSVTVLFVDYGNSDVVAAAQLRDLPAGLLRAAPRLAICCQVPDISSLTGGLPELTVDALREKLDCHAMMVAFDKPVTGYHGKSMLPCQVTLVELPETIVAVAPAVPTAAMEALHLQEDSTKTGEELGRKGHISDSDDLTIIVGYSPLELERAIEYEAALVYSSSQNDFWLQLRRDEDALASLSDEIERFVAEFSTDETAYISTPPAVGSTCLARYSSDGRWYRAEVIVVHSDTDTAELLYVDYGNTDIVQWPSRSVLQLPATIGQLPCYAVRCTLSSDSPASLQDHEDSSADYMVVAFSSVPTDHHEAAVCRLLPPKQQEHQQECGGSESEQQPGAADNADAKGEKGSQSTVEAVAAAAEDSEVPVAGELTILVEEPTATAEEPTATAEEPTATAEEPTAAAEEPTAAAEEPTAAAEESTAAPEEPTATAEEPTATAEEPTATAEEPTATAEVPTATAEVPTVTAEEPAALAEKSEQQSTVGKVAEDDAAAVSSERVDRGLLPTPAGGCARADSSTAEYCDDTSLRCLISDECLAEASGTESTSMLLPVLHAAAAGQPALDNGASSDDKCMACSTDAVQEGLQNAISGTCISAAVVGNHSLSLVPERDLKPGWEPCKTGKGGGFSYSAPAVYRGWSRGRKNVCTTSDGLAISCHAVFGTENAGFVSQDDVPAIHARELGTEDSSTSTASAPGTPADNRGLESLGLASRTVPCDVPCSGEVAVAVNGEVGISSVEFRVQNDVMTGGHQGIRTGEDPSVDAEGTTAVACEEMMPHGDNSGAAYGGSSASTPSMDEDSSTGADGQIASLDSLSCEVAQSFAFSDEHCTHECADDQGSNDQQPIARASCPGDSLLTEACTEELQVPAVTNDDLRSLAPVNHYPAVSTLPAGFDLVGCPNEQEVAELENCASDLDTPSIVMPDIVRELVSSADTCKQDDDDGSVPGKETVSDGDESRTKANDSQCRNSDIAGEDRTQPEVCNAEMSAAAATFALAGSQSAACATRLVGEYDTSQEPKHEDRLSDDLSFENVGADSGEDDISGSGGPKASADHVDVQGQLADDNAGQSVLLLLHANDEISCENVGPDSGEDDRRVADGPGASADCVNVQGKLTDDNTGQLVLLLPHAEQRVANHEAPIAPEKWGCHAEIVAAAVAETKEAGSRDYSSEAEDGSVMLEPCDVPDLGGLPSKSVVALSALCELERDGTGGGDEMQGAAHGCHELLVPLSILALDDASQPAVHTSPEDHPK